MPKRFVASQYCCIAIKKTQIIAYYASGTPTLAQIFFLDTIMSCVCAANSSEIKQINMYINY